MLGLKLNHVESPASWLFTQPFVPARIKEIIKAPRHWPLWQEFTGDRWIPRTKGQQRGKCLMTPSCNPTNTEIIFASTLVCRTVCLICCCLLSHSSQENNESTINSSPTPHPHTEQNDRHFADYILYAFSWMKSFISWLKIHRSFPKCPLDNNPAMV